MKVRPVSSLVLGLVIGLSSAFGGTTYKWKGASGGAWTDAANWEPSTGYPNAAGDVADFSDVTATASVGLSANVTVGKIVGNAGGTLTVGTFTGPTVPAAAIGITLASGASAQPEIYVPGNDSTVLYVACCFRGSQGYNKTGTGRLYQAAYNAKSYSGTSTISAGSVFYNPPTGANTEGRMGDNVEILPGAMLYITRGDTIGNAQPVHVKGGTWNITANDYIGDLTLSNGGVLLGSNFFLPNARDDGTLVKTAGTGSAGKITKRLVATSRYANGKLLPYRTVIFDVVGGSWLDWNFNCSENMEQDWDYSAANFYRESTVPATYVGRAQLQKQGGGDLLVNNMASGFSGPTTVLDGRIVFTNTVHWSGSTVVVSQRVDQVAFGRNASVWLSGISTENPGVAAAELDLNGSTLRLGGFGADAATPARFANGTLYKVGPNTQTLTAPQTMKGWKAIGGRLAFGLPAPCVRFDFDDATDFLKDTGTACKRMTNVVKVTHVATGGHRGGYAKFSNGYAETGDALGLPGGNSSFTFSAWVKLEGSADFGNGSIFGYGDPATLYPDGKTPVKYGTGATFRLNNWRFSSSHLFHSFWGGDMGVTDKTALPANFTDGNWHHYAMTYDGTTHARVFYCDGVKVLTDKSVGQDADVNLADSPFRLGGCICAVNFTGGLDDAMIFHGVLSGTQISRLYADDSAALLPTDATVTVGKGATVAFGGSTQSLASVTGPGDLNVGANGVMTLAPAANVTNSFGRLTGGGTLVKNGEGAIRLVRGNRLSGTVKLNAGSLVVQGGGLTLAGMRDSIVGYWDFDDKDNLGKDLGPNGMTLRTRNSHFKLRRMQEMAGGTFYNTDLGGERLELVDGTQTNRLPKNAETYTLAAWVKPLVASTGNIIRWGEMAGNKLCDLRFNTESGVTGVRHSYYGGDWMTDMLAYDADFFADNAPSSWHHLAVSVAADQRRLFLDGKLIRTVATGCAGKTLVPTDFFMGEFKGYLDDAAIFNRALTDAEMQQLPAGLGELGGLAVDSVDGTTVTVESGTFGLTGGAFAGALDGAGAVALSGTVALSDTTDIAPATLTVAENTVLECGAGWSGTAALRPTAAVALPEKLEIVFRTDGDVCFCPLFDCAGVFTGSTDGWTVKVIRNGKLMRSWKPEIVKTGTTISVSARASGMLLLLR